MTTEEILAEAIESGDYWADEDSLRAYIENMGTLEGFEDSFIGVYEGSDEYDAVGNYAFECDGFLVRQMPENLRMYFDWTKYGRDMVLGGDVWTERVGVDEYAIFSNH